MVDHDQKRIKARRKREIGNEVDRELLEGAGTGGGERGKGGHCGVCVDLHLLAKSTPGDKLADERGHTGPPVVLRQQRISAEEAPMARGGR